MYVYPNKLYNHKDHFPEVWTMNSSWLARYNPILLTQNPHRFYHRFSNRFSRTFLWPCVAPPPILPGRVFLVVISFFTSTFSQFFHIITAQISLKNVKNVFKTHKTHKRMFPDGYTNHLQWYQWEIVWFLIGLEQFLCFRIFSRFSQNFALSKAIIGSITMTQWR